MTITDFEIFENNRYVISHFVFKQTKRYFDYPAPEIEIFFVELPKSHKTLEELETITDQGIYFMKNAP